MCCLMMDVRRIKQRNEHIDVEQSDQRRLHFVPEPIYGLQCDESRALAWRQNRHTITLARGSGARHQSTAGKVGKHAPGSASAPGCKLFDGLEQSSSISKVVRIGRASRIKHQM